MVGFKAGAGLTIIMTQLPSLFGIAGGGHNFFERAVVWVCQLARIGSARHRFPLLLLGIGFYRAGQSLLRLWRCPFP